MSRKEVIIIADYVCRGNLGKDDPRTLKLCEHIVMGLHSVPRSDKFEYSERIVVSCKVCCEDFVLRLLVN